MRLDRAILTLAISLLAACNAQPAPLTLEDAIANNVEARGGKAALDAVQSQRIDVAIEEGGASYHGRYAATSQGLVRIDIYVEGQRVYSEGIDADGVWMRSGDGAAEESAATGARNALAHGAEDHLFGWHRFAERGHKLSLMPSEHIEGREYPVIEVKYNTGHVSYYYLDPASWLAVRKRDERAYHPDVDPTEVKVESVPGAFTKLGGVTFSNFNEDRNLETGEVLSTHRVMNRTLNPELCPNYFDRERLGPKELDAPMDC